MIEQWVDLYADEIYSFLVYIVKDVELAKDLTQETFVRAMKGLEKFRAEANPKTWLFAIARNVALSHMRKWRREVHVRDESFFERLVSSHESPEEAVIRRDIGMKLLDVLYNLKPSYREVIVCREIMGMSSEETASVLGCTVNRVRVTLHRALKAAQKKLNEGGWGHELAQSQ